MILLDTHALIWWLADPDRIPGRATRLIKEALKDGEALGVSAISIWEIAMLVNRGRLTLTMDLESWLARVEALPFLTFIPIDNAIAVRSVMLADYAQRDPADRMVIATALTHGATVVTADAQMRAYGRVQTVWK